MRSPLSHLLLSSPVASSLVFIYRTPFSLGVGVPDSALSDNEITDMGEVDKTITQPRVLVVEDSSTCAMCVGLILKALGCVTEYATNGAEAVHTLQSEVPNPFSLILMDSDMPVMDGLQATRIIKEELNVETPVILLTGESLDASTRQEMLGMGFSDALTKPLSAPALARFLSDFCGHAVGV